MHFDFWAPSRHVSPIHFIPAPCSLHSYESCTALITTPACYQQEQKDHCEIKGMCVCVVGGCWLQQQWGHPWPLAQIPRTWCYCRPLQSRAQLELHIPLPYNQEHPIKVDKVPISQQHTNTLCSLFKCECDSRRVLCLTGVMGRLQTLFSIYDCLSNASL